MLRATSFTEFVTEESSYGGVFEPDRSDRVAGVVKDDLTISLNIGKGDLEAAMGACASRLKKLQSAFSRLVSMVSNLGEISYTSPNMSVTVYFAVVLRNLIDL